MATAYLDAKQEVFDAICTQISKECGRSCIPEGNECHIEASGGDKQLRQPPSQKNRKGQNNFKRNFLAGTEVLLGASAAIAGSGVISAAVAKKVRERYQGGFKKSFDMAKNASKEVEVPRVPVRSKDVVFAVGGFGTDDAFSESKVLEKNVKSLKPNAFVEPQRHDKFNIIQEIEEEDLKISKAAQFTRKLSKASVEASSLFMDFAIKKGYNPAAVDLASRVLAYQDKYPNKNYQLIGHSGGGLIIQEVQEILAAGGQKVKATAIGTPDLGLLPREGDVITAISKSDQVINGISSGQAIGAKSFDNVRAHGQKDYFEDQEFRQFLKDRMFPDRGRRNDAYDQVIESFLRQDAKKKREKAECSGEGTQECGQVCIPESSTCRIKESGGEEEDGGKQSGGSGILLKTAVAAGVAFSGLTAATYLVQKKRYEDNFEKSVELAKEEAKNYPAMKSPPSGFRALKDQQKEKKNRTEGLPELTADNIFSNKKAEQVTLFVGGIGGDGGVEGDFMGQQVAKILPNHHIVSVESPEQDVKPRPGDSVADPSYLKRVAEAMLKDNLKDARSPVAVRIAARAYKYSQENPGMPINLIGQSGGGMPAREAMELLKRMGVKDVRLVTAASPYFGLVPPEGVSLASKQDNDPAVKLYGKTMPNVKLVDSGGHSRYFSEDFYKDIDNGEGSVFRQSRPNKSTQKFLNEYFDRSKKRQDAKGEGEPCGDGFISKEKVCRVKGGRGSRRENRKAILSKSSLNKLRGKRRVAPLSGEQIQKALSSPKLAAGVATSLGYTVLTAGVAAGVTVAAREKYRAGLNKSAEIVQRQGEARSKQKLRNFKNKSQITFVQAGFSATGGKRREAVGNKQFFDEAQKILPKHGVVGRKNSKFNLPAILSDPPKEMKSSDPDFLKVELSPPDKAKFVGYSLHQSLGTFFVKGRNPEAIDLASEVYAYHKKYPNKPKNLLGHSAGAMITREAANILGKLDVPVKVVTVGGPDFEVVGFPQTKAFHSKNDPVTGLLPNRRAAFVNDVKTHNTVDYLRHPKVKDEIKNFFGDDKRNDARNDAVEIFSITPNGSKLEAGLYKQINDLISQSLGTKTLIRNVKFNPVTDLVTGLAAVKNRIIKFRLKGNDLSYRIISSRRQRRAKRQDSRIKRNAPDCKVSLACGESCIDPRKTCRISAKNFISSGDFSKLRQNLGKLQVEKNAVSQPVPETSDRPGSAPTADKIPQQQNKVEDYKINPETGSPYTIRDLRKVARDRGIKGYGSMTISEMQESLKLADRDPESRDRITKASKKKRSFVAGAVEATGLSGRGTPNEKAVKRAVKDTTDTWRKLEALSKFAGSAPVGWGVAATGAFLLGSSIRTYERTRQNYRNNLGESAKAAQERALKISTAHSVEKNGKPQVFNGRTRRTTRFKESNITFTVGSVKGAGAETMKSLLQREKDSQNTEDYWFTNDNYVIPFNLKEFGSPQINAEPNSPDWIANEVVNGIGGAIRNYTRGRNQDAVDLAAQLYAHGIAIGTRKGGLLNKDKKINIVAHSAGGLVTKEALEILSRMNVKGSPSGKKILEQVNAVYLGTPHFGFAENISGRQRTIISAQDPVSVIPAFSQGARQQWISSVPGHTAQDYLQDNNVRDAIREAFGYYQAAPEEVTRRRRARRRDDSSSRGRVRQSNRVKPGHTWVDDKRVKAGGYWRKLPKNRGGGEKLRTSGRRFSPATPLLVAGAVATTGGVTAGLAALSLKQQREGQIKVRSETVPGGQGEGSDPTVPNPIQINGQSQNNISANRIRKTFEGKTGEYYQVENVPPILARDVDLFLDNEGKQALYSSLSESFKAIRSVHSLSEAEIDFPISHNPNGVAAMIAKKNEITGEIRFTHVTVNMQRLQKKMESEGAEKATKFLQGAVIHEMGHTLDLKVLGTEKRFASSGYSPLDKRHLQNTPERFMKPLVDRLRGSAGLERIKRETDKADDPRLKKFGNYLQEDLEVFARAYSQYIAFRSGDVQLLDSIKAIENKATDTVSGDVIDFGNLHWDEREFLAIAEEFDKVLKSQKLRSDSGKLQVYRELMSL